MFSRSLLLPAVSATILLLGACSNQSNRTPLGPDGPGAASQHKGPGQQHEQVPAIERDPYGPSVLQTVVSLASGVTPQDIATQTGLTIVEILQGGKLVLFEGEDVFMTWDQVSGVKEFNENEPIYMTQSLDLLFGYHEGVFDEDEAEGQDALSALSIHRLHGRVKGHQVIVATLDTGADVEHPFLADHLLGLDESEDLASHEWADGIDNDGDLVIDEAYGHGTHVAGILHMVAPEALILPIRVLNSDGVGGLWDLLRGLELAEEYGASIINLSLSLSGVSRLLEDELERLKNQNINIVAASGNRDWRNPTYPGTSRHTLGVAAVDGTDFVPTFSGAGSAVDFSAPGVSILSCFPGGGQARATGTSMASPWVAGSLALLRQYNGLSALTAANLLKISTSPNFPVPATAFGRIDPSRAVLTASGLITEEDDRIPDVDADPVERN